MKLLTRTKACAFLATAAVVPALVLTGSASADPTNPAAPRPLAGMGSDTTQEVLNALSNVITIDGQKVLASYDATGGAIGSTKDPLPAGTDSCAYAANTGTSAPATRANGSGQGRSRLLEALTPDNDREGCLDFARSSSLTLGAVPAATGGLTYVPFAIDAVTYAVRSDSSITKRLTAAQLKTVYECNAGPNFIPVLPNASSGTRQFFLQAIGNPTLGPCVVNGTVNGTVIQENDGSVLTDRRMLVPYSVAQYNVQSTGIGDLRAQAVLGAIGGVTSQSINTTAPTGVRTVYNVIPTRRIGTNPADATLNRVFVGSGSLLCTVGAPVITQQGFAPSPECGETDQATP